MKKNNKKWYSLKSIFSDKKQYYFILSARHHGKRSYEQIKSTTKDL